MESKILQVFYGNDALPYKDKERSVHFPIIGNAFQGDANTNEIRFYTDRLGDSNATYVAVSKLPNGKIGSKVLQTYNDSTLGEHYALLQLDSFYTQYKGDLFISLQGYQGGVTVEYDDDDDIYVISGTPTIKATGSVKLAINYATQFVGSGEDENADIQALAALIGTKLNISNGIFVANLDTLNPSNYEDGQLIFDIGSQQYFKVDSGNFVLVDGGNGILASSRTLVRYDISDETLNWNGTLSALWSLTGNKVCIVRYSGNDYLVQMHNATRVCAFSLETREFYWDDELESSDNFSALITNTNKITYVETTNVPNRLYGTNDSGYQSTLNYGVNANANYIPQRDANGQIKVPLAPTDNAHATSKKYVDDYVDGAIATIKQNAFIVVDTTTYPTLNSFLATTGEEGYIYLYPIDNNDLTKGYQQYIWESNGWLFIGYTRIDLEPYATKYYVDTRFNYLMNIYEFTQEQYNDIYEQVVLFSSMLGLIASDYAGGYVLYTYTGSVSGDTVTLLGTVAGTTLTLQDTSFNFYTKSESNTLLNGKVDKTNSAYKVYGTGYGGAQETYPIDDFYDGNIARRNANGSITIPLTPTYNGDAASKQYVDAFAKSLTVEINSSTYVLSFTLKDKNNNTLSSQTVDLPLETMVVSGEYDDDTQSLVLELKNGQTITIPISDLIDGLVSQSSLNTILASYYTKAQVDGLLNNYYTKAQLDVYFNNIYTKSYIDQITFEYSQLLNNFVNNYVIGTILYNNEIVISGETAYVSGTVNGSIVSLGNESLNVYTKAQSDTFAKSLEMELDPNTYVLTIYLKDATGSVLSTQTANLPLESVIVDGTYDSQNETIVLELASGQYITIPVSDLVSGLVSQDSLELNYYNKSQADNKFATKQELNNLQSELNSVKLGLESVATLLNAFVPNFVVMSTWYSNNTTISTNTATVIGSVSGTTVVVA